MVNYSPTERPPRLPTNYPAQPAPFPSRLFRLQVEAAQRYLFETELKEALEAIGLIFAEVIQPNWTGQLVHVGQVARFMQGLRAIVQDEKARTYGTEALRKSMPALPRPSGAQERRRVSSADKTFLRIREVMAMLNAEAGASYLVKWHGGADCDVFEDSGQHCYGYLSESPACHTMTGYLEEAIRQFAGLQVRIEETECMALGGLACRWHCHLIA